VVTLALATRHFGQGRRAQGSIEGRLDGSVAIRQWLCGTGLQKLGADALRELQSKTGFAEHQIDAYHHNRTKAVAVFVRGQQPEGRIRLAG
jgi:hypothetical protein